MTSENIQALKKQIKNSEIKELKELDIKYLPRLHFVEDKSFDYAERIEKLIKENKNK